MWRGWRQTRAGLDMPTRAVHLAGPRGEKAVRLAVDLARRGCEASRRAHGLCCLADGSVIGPAGRPDLSDSRDGGRADVPTRCANENGLRARHRPWCGPVPSACTAASRCCLRLLFQLVICCLDIARQHRPAHSSAYPAPAYWARRRCLYAWPRGLPAAPAGRDSRSSRACKPSVCVLTPCRSNASMPHR